MWVMSKIIYKDDKVYIYVPVRVRDESGINDYTMVKMSSKREGEIIIRGLVKRRELRDGNYESKVGVD